VLGKATAISFSFALFPAGITFVLRSKTPKDRSDTRPLIGELIRLAPVLPCRLKFLSTAIFWTPYGHASAVMYGIRQAVFYPLTLQVLQKVANLDARPGSVWAGWGEHEYLPNVDLRHLSPVRRVRHCQSFICPLPERLVVERAVVAHAWHSRPS